MVNVTEACCDFFSNEDCKLKGGARPHLFAMKNRKDNFKDGKNKEDKLVSVADGEWKSWN